MIEAKDYIGKTYNYLTILKPTEKKRGNWYVLCKCKCGNTHIARLNHILSGEIQSCGCRIYEKEKQNQGTHHIWSKNPRIDKIWNGMLYRCYNPKKDTFKHYGGRGIRVCDEWLPENNGAENFYNWAINNGYKDKLTIERIDVNGNYCPENCKWITQAEQMQNTRKSHRITIGNKTKCVNEWCRIYNIFSSTYYARKRKGLSDEEAITKPSQRRRKC